MYDLKPHFFYHYGRFQQLIQLSSDSLGSSLTFSDMIGIQLQKLPHPTKIEAPSKTFFFVICKNVIVDVNFLNTLD